MGSTKKELLEEVLKLYSSVSAVTDKLFHSEPDEQVTLMEQRGSLIAEIETSLSHLDTLPDGGSEAELTTLKSQIKEALTIAISQDDLIQNQLRNSMKDVRKQLQHTLPKKRAVENYRLNSRN